MLEQPKKPQITKPPINLFQCNMCHQIFIQPITVSCGHTFCRNCLVNYGKHLNKKPTLCQHKQKKVGDHPQQTNNQSIKINGAQELKIPMCSACDNIIWNSIEMMSENTVIQNLIEKYYFDEMKERIKNNPGLAGKSNRKSSIQQVGSGQEYRNKILVQIKEPEVIMMPHCYSNVEFSTHFIHQIAYQGNQLIFTWDELYKRRLGILGAVKNIKLVYSGANSNKIVDNPNNLKVCQQTYTATFFGKAFVRLSEISIVPINIKNRYIIMRENNINKILVDLYLCDCRIEHAKNCNQYISQDYQKFFSFYDQLNNPHYMRQLTRLISQIPFNSRNCSQQMIYCALKVLKIPQKTRKQLVMSFNDQKRMEYMDKFLQENEMKQINQIMNVSIPGQSSTTFVLVTIFILLVINLIQNA